MFLNNPFTIMVVPGLDDVLVIFSSLPLAYSILVAISDSRVLVVREKLQTDAILGRASPLNPRELI
jgi:hypothetical protein